MYFFPLDVCHIDCFKRFLLIWLSRAYALKSMIDALGKPPSSPPPPKKEKEEKSEKTIYNKEKALLKGKKEEQKKCQHATLKVYVVIVICRELDD